MATRQEHIAQCKKTALEYINQGDITEAFASMGSDLKKHPETADHPGILLGVQLMMIGDLNTPEKMRRFIEGFN
jgi:hypothetical protein